MEDCSGTLIVKSSYNPLIRIKKIEFKLLKEWDMENNQEEEYVPCSEKKNTAAVLKTLFRNIVFTFSCLM